MSLDDRFTQNVGTPEQNMIGQLMIIAISPPILE